MHQEFASLEKEAVHIRQRKGMIIFEKALRRQQAAWLEHRPVKEAHAHWRYNLVTHLRIAIWPEASTGSLDHEQFGRGPGFCSLLSRVRLLPLIGKRPAGIGKCRPRGVLGVTKKSFH